MSLQTEYLYISVEYELPPISTIKAVASVHANTWHISAVFSHHESLQHHDMNNDDHTQITQSHTNTHTQIYTHKQTWRHKVRQQLMGLHRAHSKCHNRLIAHLSPAESILFVFCSQRCPAARPPAAVKRPLKPHLGRTSGLWNQNEPVLRVELAVSVQIREPKLCNGNSESA